MAGVGDFLAALFAFLGPAGTVIALYVIFVVDAALLPVFPEFFVVLFFIANQGTANSFAWATTLWLTAIAGEVTGNSLIYLIVKRALVASGKMPKRIERAMAGWVNFLIVRDERVILLNRVAPVVPMVGAFIAVMRWNVRLSLAYIALGAAVKYAALLALAGWLGVTVSPSIAGAVTILLVLAIVAASVSAGYVRRRRIVNRIAGGRTGGPPGPGPSAP